MKWFHLLPLLLLFGCQQKEEKASFDGKQVSVTGGQISGALDEPSAVWSFKGIPFAAPPTGANRWRAPQPIIPWEGIKMCTTFGPSPMQAKPVPFLFWSREFLIPESPISEDCLYLNVWTGAADTQEKRPVLVYIYGGGFQSGGSGCPIYDGTSMAKKGVVFVSLNYRVGKFGFLSHPALSQENPSGTSGNYGMLDMIAALQWVKQNIQAFGGDPENVTIAGQSAGAFGVNYLTVSPLANGLFQRAIGESGGNFYATGLRGNADLHSAEEVGLAFADSLHVSTLEELRQLPAEEILNAPLGTSWPIVDGYVIPASVYSIYQNGTQNDVSLLVGWNANDLVMGPPMPMEAFQTAMAQRFGEDVDHLWEVYPCHNSEESDAAQRAMNRDQTFGIQVYTWAKMQAESGKKPVYVYNFNRSLPAYGPETQFGAFHSGEIVYAYDNLRTLDRPWQPVDQEIATQMSGYWVNFAKTGNPNGDGLPTWNAYTPKENQIMVIDTVCELVSLPSLQQMHFWEAYFQKQ